MKKVKAPKGEAERPRREVPPIKVFVTDDEKAELSRRAASCGLSNAAFMRAAGLNQPVKPRADLEAVRELVRVSGDLGRVAGLLKLWLAEKRGQGASPAEVERMMIEFRELQQGIREQMSAIVLARK